MNSSDLVAGNKVSIVEISRCEVWDYSIHYFTFNGTNFEFRPKHERDPGEFEKACITRCDADFVPGDRIIEVETRAEIQAALAELS